MIMNNLLKYSIFSIVLLLAASCTDFDELNTNPTKATTINPNMQLSYIQLETWGDWLINEVPDTYFAAFVQQLQGDWSTTTYGGKYTLYNNLSEQFWNRVYSRPLLNAVDLIHRTEGDSLYLNVRSITRIMRVYYSMLLTDMFGNVPYFDAGKGYIDGNFNPAYDSQELIYKDFLKELKESGESFSENGGTVTGDVIYNGDLAKWRRFANSLRLRTAMRLVKVEPELAKETLIDILNSEDGLMLLNEDALVPYTIDVNDWDAEEFRRNGLSQVWRTRDTYPTTYFCSVFFNQLKDTKDPRLFVLARLYDESDSDPFKRKDITDLVLTEKDTSWFQPVLPGFFWYDSYPNGYWSTTNQAWYQKELRPQINRAFLRGNTPGVLMSYAETEYLLSEAVVRWGSELPNTLTPRQHYMKGVIASMQFLANYEKTNLISTTQISAYLAANPFPNDAESQIKMINEQLWILHINNAPEAYANWRRSGYPQLKPASEYGAVTINSTEIPRRLQYPIFESTYNKAEYDKQIQLMDGTDNWNYRIWWDKE